MRKASSIDFFNIMGDIAGNLRMLDALEELLSVSNGDLGELFGEILGGLMGSWG